MTVDPWMLMTLHLAGQPLPALPAIPGRVCRCAAHDEHTAALFTLVFGREDGKGSARPVRGAGAASLRAVLLADGYGAAPNSAEAVA